MRKPCPLSDRSLVWGVASTTSRWRLAARWYGQSPPANQDMEYRSWGMAQLKRTGSECTVSTIIIDFPPSLSKYLYYGIIPDANAGLMDSSLTLSTLNSWKRWLSRYVLLLNTKHPSRAYSRPHRGGGHTTPGCCECLITWSTLTLGVCHFDEDQETRLTSMQEVLAIPCHFSTRNSSTIDSAN